jgi:hypothetical protein
MVDGFDHILHFSVDRLMERLSGTKSSTSSTYANQAGGSLEEKKDHLDSFLEAKRAYPDLIKDENIIMYIVINVSQCIALQLTTKTLTTDTDHRRRRPYIDCAESHHILHASQPIGAQQASG